MRRQQGFTLIELMIVVAIIAILSAIAIPAYSDYVMRSRITEAVSTLSAQRVKMEQFYQDNRTYAGSYVSGTVAPQPADSPPNAPLFHYPLPTLSNNGQSYVISATGMNAMAGFTYTVDQSNNRTSFGPTGWASPNPNNCWLLKRDGSC